MNVLVVGSSFLGSTGGHDGVHVFRTGTIASACSIAKDRDFGLIVLCDVAYAGSSKEWVDFIKLSRGAMIVDESSVPNGDLVAYSAVVSLNKKESAIDDVVEFANEIACEIKGCLDLLGFGGEEAGK
jgi:hypothetical protein